MKTILIAGEQGTRGFYPSSTEQLVEYAMLARNNWGRGYC
jgi:hypothetical protein